MFSIKNPFRLVDTIRDLSESEKIFSCSKQKNEMFSTHHVIQKKVSETIFIIYI